MDLRGELLGLGVRLRMGEDFWLYLCCVDFLGEPEFSDTMFYHFSCCSDSFTFIPLGADDLWRVKFDGWILAGYL